MTQQLMSTRKLSYRKDDRAMRPMKSIWTPWKLSAVSTPLTMSTATFPKIFDGLFSRLMLWICVQNLNFVALPVPKIIRCTQKLGQSMDTPTLLFFNQLLFAWTVWMYLPNLKSVTVSSLVPEIIAIGVLGFWVGVTNTNPQSWGRGGRRGRGWYHSKEHRWFSIGPP